MIFNKIADTPKTVVFTIKVLTEWETIIAKRSGECAGFVSRYFRKLSFSQKFKTQRCMRLWSLLFPVSFLFLPKDLPDSQKTKADIKHRDNSHLLSLESSEVGGRQCEPAPLQNLGNVSFLSCLRARGACHVILERKQIGSGGRYLLCLVLSMEICYLWSSMEVLKKSNQKEFSKAVRRDSSQSELSE